MLASSARRSNYDWARVLRVFEKARFDEITTTEESVKYQHKTLCAAMHASLEALGSEDMKKRYLELAIFPNEEAIPAPTLAAYWGCDADRATYLIEQYDDASMGQKSVSGLVVHDLQLHVWP